jgi:membrane glycosyltransferase
MGVMSYVSAPLWILALVLSTIEALKETLGKHPYFPHEQTLFSTWRISVQHRTMLLFVAVMALLMLPKVFSLMLHLRNRERAAEFGGRLKLSLRVLLETLFSALITPILASERTRFVVGTLMGRNVKWQAQQRDEMKTSWHEALGRHAAVTLLGLAWSGLLLFASPRLFGWFSPVLAGLVLAIPVSVWSSRATAGAWAKRHGLWLIPEEIVTPQLLERLQEELKNAHARQWATPRDGLAWVLEDAKAFEVHLALPPSPAESDDPLHQHRLEGLRLKGCYHGLGALTSQEKRELLLDPDSIRSLKLEPRSAQGTHATAGADVRTG